MDNKSKFGLGAGLMGALVYLIGGFSSIALVVLFVAIALWEENEFVKVSVKRVATVYLGYVLLVHVLSLIYNIVHLFTSNTGVFGTVYNKVDSVVDIAYYVIILYLALKALVKPVVETSILDGKAVDSVANAVNTVANSVTSAAAAAGTKKNNVKICPKCGREVPENAQFCTGCGNKFDAPSDNANA